MHRRMRDRLEEVLAGSPDTESRQHIASCPECRGEVAAMREQREMLRELRAPHEIGPKSGFYARVRERIETQGPASVWTLFAESVFGRRIAVASMAVALLLSIFVVSSEQRAATAASERAALLAVDGEPQADILKGEPAVMLTGAPNEDQVLVNLVTYPER